MAKWLCLGSLGVGALLFVAFLLDLFIAEPFGGLSIFVDVLCVLSSGILVYLGWDAYSDVK